MFDDYSELTVNRYIETPESREKDLISDVLKDEIEKDKDEDFFDLEFLSRVRRDIASARMEEKGLSTVYTEKFIKRRLSFFKRILKLLIGWEEFTGGGIIPEEEIIYKEAKRAESVDLSALLELEQQLIEKQIEQKKPAKKVIETEETEKFKFKIDFNLPQKIFLKYRKKYLGSNHFLNIDIGSDSIKYSHISKKNGELILEDYGIKKLRLADDESQEGKNTKVSNALSLLEIKSYINISDTIVTISDISKKLKVDKFPKVSEKDLKNLILFNLKNDRNAEFGEGVTFEYQILGTEIEEEVEKYIVLIAWTQLSEINNYISVLKECGIVPSKITFSMMGVLEYVKNFGEKFSEEAGIIMDLGAVNTTLVFYDKGLVKFIREIKFGSKDFTDALVGNYIVSNNEVEVDFEKAENIKYDFGIPPADNIAPAYEGITYAQLHQKMKHVLERFIVEINRTINYFRSNFRGVELQKIYLSGGGALMLHLDEYLSDETGLKISRLSVFDKVKIGNNISDGYNLSREYYKLINSIGIILEDVKTLNFLPKNLKELRKRSVAKLFSVMVTITAFIIVAIFSLNAFNNLKDVNNILNEVKRKWNSLNNTQKAYLSLQNEKQSLLKIREDFKIKINLFSEGNQAFNILKMVSNLIPSSITVNTLNYTEKGSGENENIIIEGKMTDKTKNRDDELYNFYLNLEKSGYFSNVIVEKTSGELNESSNLPDFIVTCYLE